MSKKQKSLRYFSDLQSLEKTNRNDNEEFRENILKYKRGENVVKYLDIKSKYHRTKEIFREKQLDYAAETSARTEILLIEDTGFINPDKDEESYNISQRDIVEQIGISSAANYFDLKLDQFGPYSLDYTRNGQSLLLGGLKGHLAAFDWHSKHLKFEINVMEAINCVKWLHTENMLAVGQKKWLHIYDNQGVELHCLKKLNNILKLEYLPYHFLLAASNNRGFLSWLDISVGRIVANHYTSLGYLDVMCQNPQNAITLLGSANGTVTMWSPNNAQPLATMLCHRAPVRGLCVDPRGIYMASTDTDRNLHIWDVRNFKILDAFKLSSSANELVYSQTELLAVSLGSRVEIYKDCIKDSSTPYMVHNVPLGGIKALKFCPYEDVLGIGHTNGFSSIIIPGAGEANFDSLEANPFQTKSQRKEWEVKALLGKIQPELISLDPFSINAVNCLTLQEKLEARNKILSLKPKKMDIHIKKRKVKKAASASKVTARKEELLLKKRKDFQDNLTILNMGSEKKNVSKTQVKANSNSNVPSALERFKNKKGK